MSISDRDEALHTFRTKKDTTICLMSIRTGAYGLNLTCASRCIIFDPNWNPFIEEQASDRVHRWGQTKEVIIYRLIAENTIEERILLRQNEV
jgi:SNF2 family DNA or RNA helicase